MLLSTCLSLKSPIITKEVALADLMAFTLAVLEVTTDPLNRKQSPQTGQTIFSPFHFNIFP
uniref:Uncharacterized protein LOC105121156 isoform X1 n=1 Tax=Rhizophora mucronata TaxID=61149 RepID=A0A2P2LVW5_RHIMU